MSIATNLADINAFTNDHIIPRLVDTVFNNAMLFNYLLERRRIRFSGGLSVKSPLQYAKTTTRMFARTGGSGWSPAYQATDASVYVNMKYAAADVYLYGVDDVVNAGREAAFSQVESKMYAAAQSLTEYLGGQIFKDGQSSAQDVTDTGGILSPVTHMDGLLAWIDDGNDYGTYATVDSILRSFATVGGVARADLISGGDSFAGATTPDNRLFGTTSYVDRAFTSFSLPLITKAIGKVWHGAKSPDLIVGNNAVWNRFSDAIQPLQRVVTADLGNGKSGFKALEYQGANVMVDKLCPSQACFGLNTDTIELHLSDKKKFQFGFTGFKEAQTGIDLVGQVLAALNLLCNSPRHNFKLLGAGLS